MRSSHIGTKFDGDENLAELLADDTRAVLDRGVLLKVRDVIAASLSQTRFDEALAKMQSQTSQLIVGGQLQVVLGVASIVHERHLAWGRGASAQAASALGRVHPSRSGKRTKPSSLISSRLKSCRDTCGTCMQARQTVVSHSPTAMPPAGRGGRGRGAWCRPRCGCRPTTSCCAPWPASPAAAGAAFFWLVRGQPAGPPRSGAHIQVVGGRHELLHLLLREDVQRHEVALGVAVLARLGRGHVNHLGRDTGDARSAARPDGLHSPGGLA